MKLIEVRNLTKKYKGSEEEAVKDATFNVEEGEFFAFLGPNGAGKTTTISILTTTLSLTSGTVTIAGCDVEKESKKIRDQIGVIFQKPSLDLNLTAEENIRLHASLYGLYSFRPIYQMMPKEYKDKLNELSEILDISEDMFKPLKTFSGGMKRKMEIIRSLMHNPKVLFLDEPTTGLDPKSRKDLWEYLSRTIEQNRTTVFLTTHYLEEAEDADRVCIINKGKIVANGKPADLKSQLVSNYIGLYSDEKEKLKSELESKKIDYTETKTYMKIDVMPKDVQKLIKSIDTPLSDIDVHTPTLEEAYLEIIGR